MTPLRTQSKKTSRAISLSRAFVPLSLTISTPIARPSPRVSPTIERSSHSFTRFRALPPIRAARSGIRSRCMMSIVTAAATQAAGWPPKVVPATTSSFPIDRSSPRTAPRGIRPPPSPLPIETRSGATPKCSIPHIFPARPSPASTSSALKNQPGASASPGAGELEEHASQVVRGTNREQSLRDVDHRHVRIHEEDEEAVPLEGIDGCLEDFRMDISEVVRRPLAREVDVLFAFDVVEEGALRRRDHDVGEFRVVGPEVFRVQLGVPLPVPVLSALRPDRGPRLLLRHPRRERRSGPRGFGPGL